jgi:ABC-type Zn uptake system ZnuABC Zn-binding protein ZnuA
MKRNFLTILIVCLILFMTGCGSSGSNNKSNIVDKLKYDHIKEGMSYAQVVEIIGSKGQETGHSTTSKNYWWKNPDGSGLYALFVKDELVVKSQTGLK